MVIRNAEPGDADGIIRLLKQVLELHASLRPDIFVSGTTKYTRDEVVALINDGGRRSFVAEDENGEVAGYALCVVKEQPRAENMVKFRSLFVDDLCVDQDERGKRIGTLLFDRVKKEARELGCYEITLAVWEGNDGARRFYDKMGMRPKETMMEFILSDQPLNKTTQPE